MSPIMAQNLTARRALHTVEPKLVGRIDSAFSEQIDRPIVAKPIDSIPQRIGRNLILDVSDLVFYIGHHANLTGIQRVQACLILALFRVGDNPSITCLSWDRANSRFLKLSNSYFVRLLKDITRPEPDRTIQFDVKAARDGILPEAQLFHALPDETEENTFILLGAAWVNPEDLLLRADDCHDAGAPGRIRRLPGDREPPSRRPAGGTVDCRAGPRSQASSLLGAYGRRL